MADRLTGPAWTTRSAVMAPQAMAATSHPLATQIAVNILRGDGTAVDAAIAANAALGLMEPTGCGIGGDLFAIVWDERSGRLHGLNASGRSPRALTRERLVEQRHSVVPERGPLSISVPGAVDGWFELHGRFGRLPMAEILQPAIDYARHGHPVHETIAAHWERSIPPLSGFPGFSEQMTLGGRAPRVGETWRNPNLADTMERIAGAGRDAFYLGDIAEAIANYVQANGGFLGADDLAAHRSDWVEPVSVDYRGCDVWELPPNGQGIAVLQMLRLIERFDVGGMGFGSADWVHLFLEAKKLVFEDRARFYADPDYMETPVSRLLSEDYAAERAQLIDMHRSAARVPHGNPAALRRGDTICLATADREGNMVSLIQSNYLGMGSGMTPPGLGFVLQNRGAGFSLQAGHPNAIAPGKRPFHTIIPAFVTRSGRPWLAFGLMGADMQPQGQVQILVNLIDFGMGLQEAGDAPRIYHSGSSGPNGLPMHLGGVVSLEHGIDTAVVRELQRRGHHIGSAPGHFGGFQAVMRHPDHGTWIGASESRKDGQAAGF